MGYALEFIEHENYLEVRFPPYSDQNSYREFIAATIAECKKRDFRSLLADVTALEAGLPIMDDLELGTFVVETAAPTPIKMAVLFREEAMKGDRFFETVVRNRGGQLKEFSDRVDAENWLLDSN
jgi:hypothetical protein